MVNNPNVGPVTALVTSLLSAIMGVLTAFNVFHFNSAQQAAVGTLAFAAVPVALLVYSILQSWHVVTIQKLTVQRQALTAQYGASAQGAKVPPSMSGV